MIVFLKGINTIKNLSFMFSDCNNLSSLSNLSDLDLRNIKNISYMFSGCSMLTKLPDISSWNTLNIIDMSNLFYNCSSLNLFIYINYYIN